MNVQADRAQIPAHTASVRYLTLTITAPDPGRRADRAPVNVALVLDRSGSMSGRKLEMARLAVDRAIRLLDGRDRLALVCYDNEIDTLLGCTPATAEAKANALNRLKTIDARGSTDLCGGWLRGVDELSKSPAEAGALSRVLLLSDGLANQGESDPEVLAGKAAELRARGISTSTFGIGADFDERLMSRLATDGGGHFYFIEQAAQIPDFLQSEIGETLEVVARDARLIVVPGPGTDVRTLNAFPLEAHQDGLHVRLGDLVAGQEVTIVLAVRSEPREADAHVAIAVRLTDREHVLFSKPMPIDWQVVDTEVDAAQPVNRAVLVTVGELFVERARADALEANRRGDFEAALRIIQAAVEQLRALGPGIGELEALINQVQQHDQPAFGRAMDSTSMKQVFYQSAYAQRSRDAAGKARKRNVS